MRWLQSLGTEPPTAPLRCAEAQSCPAPGFYWLTVCSGAGEGGICDLLSWLAELGFPYWEGKHRKGRQGVPASMEGTAKGRAGDVTHSVDAEELIPGIGIIPSLPRPECPHSVLPPGPYEMQPVLAACPLPSSHQLGTASSLCWQGSSRPSASSCIQRPELPTPRRAPAGGQRCLHPRAGLGSCRPCLAVLGRVGSQAEEILWERVCSGNNRAAVGGTRRGRAGQGAGQGCQLDAALDTPCRSLSGSECAQRRQGLHVLCWRMLSTGPLSSGPQEGSGSS